MIVKSEHAHRNDKEYLSYEGYERNEEYITIEGEEDLYRFMDKKNLMRISDNLDVILNTQEQNVDYTEYRYRYIYMQPIPHTRKVGKTTTTYFTYIPVTRYSWTSNPNHSRLTGETRLCHYVYVAYKIEKNEKGKYVLIPSEQVDDIREVMDEYPYISKKYIKVVNINGEEVDYEDGKEEELTEEEQNRIEEYEEENEQLKKELEENKELIQFKEQVFNLINKKLEENEKELNGVDTAMYYANKGTLNELKKELKE